MRAAGIGLGDSQLGHDRKEDAAIGVSLDANFNNGFRAILNWGDMGDNVTGILGVLNDQGTSEQYIGVGYTVDDWTLAANWGQYAEDIPGTANDRGQSGYALVANYDLGGGAEVQLGYASTECETIAVENSTFVAPLADTDCGDVGDSFSRISLGVAMSF